MEHRKQVTETNIERRAYSDGMEIRASDGKSTLRGYAARFGSVYDMGWFTEEVSRDAFKGADMTDVRVLFNHDPNQILGRTKAGTARVGVDEIGLWYEVDLPESATAIREAVQRGDVAESSWGFSLSADKWEMRDGKQHRTLTEVRTVYDTSPVTFPANPDTTVAARSLARSADRWDLKYLIEEQAWALSSGNDMVSRMNYWIENFAKGDALGIGIESEMQQIAQQSKVAKAALLSIIDGFAEIIKKANNNENRGKVNNDPGDEQEEQRQEDIKTLIEIALLERQFFTLNP